VKRLDHALLMRDPGVALLAIFLAGPTNALRFSATQESTFNSHYFSYLSIDLPGLTGLSSRHTSIQKIVPLEYL
jgi:hypothetical protein